MPAPDFKRPRTVLNPSLPSGRYLFVGFVEHFYVDIILPFVGLNFAHSELAKAAVVKSSVADPDPEELYVFGHHGSGSISTFEVRIRILL